MDRIHVDKIVQREDDGSVLFEGTLERDQQRVSFHLPSEHARLMESAIKRDGFCIAEVPKDGVSQ